ncbi:MAG: MEMO1 family protein [Chloroflexi bacterium]|jgi:MEMO1 family protein|nr:MEMO1 family protein [Chloroflexota bacterium]
MARNATVAGRFYPGTRSALQGEIERFTANDVPKEEVIGVVSPHAGYIYSGLVAGTTFSRVNIKDTCVILGPNHTGQGYPASIMVNGSWETPLGEVEIDSDLAIQILNNSEYLEEDEIAHVYEHSIEVQLPFLQYFKKDVKIVPIVLAYSDSTVYKEIGSSIARAVRETGRETVIVASSDMTHYESQESAKSKDMKAIQAILDLDEDALFNRIKDLKISMCGYAPTISMIRAAKRLGAQETELVQYQTSGDVSGDYTRVVGYAGVIIK